MKKEDSTANASEMEYITVQRLSSNVEGRYEKYARISPLGMVPLGCEPTIDNIKTACERFFFNAEDMECDILAGERGPSWTDTNQISNWKTLHVRFVERTERSEESIMCDKMATNDIKATPIT